MAHPPYINLIDPLIVATSQLLTDLFRKFLRAPFTIRRNGIRAWVRDAGVSFYTRTCLLLHGVTLSEANDAHESRNNDSWINKF